MKKRYSIRGFTLVELIVVLAILGVFLSFALPSFRHSLQTNKFVANSNQLAAALKYARTEALKRRAAVTVCGLNAAKTACSGSTDWGANGFGALDSSSNILKVWLEPTQYDDLTMTSSSASATYASSGMLNSGSTIGVRIAFTDVTDNRCVEISTTGRVNTQTIQLTDSCP